MDPLSNFLRLLPDKRQFSHWIVAPYHLSLIIWLWGATNHRSGFQVFSKDSEYGNDLLAQMVAFNVCFKKTVTTSWVGHFTTIFSHFSANYIKNFHKTEVLMTILKCQMCLNLNWIKSYNTKHNLFLFPFFKFCKKKIRLINDHFTTKLSFR